MDVPLTPFEVETDRFRGVTVRESHVPADVAIFSAKLQASLEAWRASGQRCVWVHVPTLLLRTHLAPLMDLGFSMHHADPNRAVLMLWLPEDEKCNVPEFCHTYIGVGGLCIDEETAEVLVVSERFRLDSELRWKLPGGHVDMGEWWGAAAEREVVEETGVRAQFMGIVSMRHNTRYAFQRSDVYVVCRLRPLSREVRMDPKEIAAVRWLHVAEFADDQRVYIPNRMMIRAACGLPASTDEDAVTPLRRLVATHAPHIILETLANMRAGAAAGSATHTQARTVPAATAATSPIEPKPEVAAAAIAGPETRATAPTSGTGSKAATTDATVPTTPSTDGDDAGTTATVHAARGRALSDSSTCASALSFHTPALGDVRGLERLLEEHPELCTRVLRHMLRACTERELRMQPMHFRLSHYEVRWQLFSAPPVFFRTSGGVDAIHQPAAHTGPTGSVSEDGTGPAQALVAAASDSSTTTDTVGKADSDPQY